MTFWNFSHDFRIVAILFHAWSRQCPKTGSIIDIRMKSTDPHRKSDKENWSLLTQKCNIFPTYFTAITTKFVGTIASESIDSINTLPIIHTRIAATLVYIYKTEKVTDYTCIVKAQEGAMMLLYVNTIKQYTNGYKTYKREEHIGSVVKRYSLDGV